LKPGTGVFPHHVKKKASRNYVAAAPGTIQQKAQNHGGKKSTKIFEHVQIKIKPKTGGENLTN